MQTETELTTKEKARLMKNAYQRQWAKKNPDKIKASRERYFARKYDEMIEQMLEEFKTDHVNEKLDPDFIKAVVEYDIRHDLERGDSDERR